MWLAVDRAGKEVLGFNLEDRSEETSAKLYKSLSGLQISSYDTDYWAAYGSMLYKERPMQNKVATYTVESRNRWIRHYLARFRHTSSEVIAALIEVAPHKEETIMTAAQYLRQEGMQQGRQQGIQQGRQEGIQARNWEIAKNMIFFNEPKEKIRQFTGLSWEEIERLLRDKK